MVPTGGMVMQEYTKHNSTHGGARWALALILVHVLHMRASPRIKTISRGGSGSLASKRTRAIFG